MTTGSWHNPYTILAGVLVLGIGAQWIAWRLHLPAILLLLLIGLAAGEIGFINPDTLLGDLLIPIVSFSVALILFEGALSLKMTDLKASGITIRNMVTVGLVVTWLLCTLACHWILQLPVSISLLISGILTVTGPTVILPMLRYIRPSGNTARILKWEGIVNDPLGTLLAIIVFESILASGFQATFMTVFNGITRTILLGTVLGLAVTWAFIFTVRRQWIPVYLQSPIMLMLLLATFAVSNHFQADSGLFTVTVMGIFLANQRLINVTHIVEFKENLGLILLSSLFVLLAARLQVEDFFALGWRGLVFLAVLILVIRPLAVLASTRNSNLTREEKTFLSFLAPRGIVAAAISSVFALRLEEAGYPNGDAITRTIFLTIIGTVAIYSLSAMPLAKALNLAGKAQGVLILSAHPWTHEIAKALRKVGVPVIMVDSNIHNIYEARMNGLETFHGNILSDRTMEELDLTDFGHMLALTPNNEVNSLAGLRFQSIFGKEHIYQLPPAGSDSPAKPSKDISEHLQGKLLFGRAYSSDYLENLHRLGWQARVTTLSRDFGYEALQQNYNHEAIPLFLVNEQGGLQFYTAESGPVPKPEQKLAFLAPPEPADKQDGKTG